MHPGFVGFEVAEDHVLELARIEHLRNGVTNVLVEPVHPCVDEGGALVVDQELVELKIGVWKRDRGADPVDPVDHFVYPGHGLRSSLLENME